MSHEILLVAALLFFFCGGMILLFAGLLAISFIGWLLEIYERRRYSEWRDRREIAAAVNNERPDLRVIVGGIGDEVASNVFGGDAA